MDSKRLLLDNKSLLLDNKRLLLDIKSLLLDNKRLLLDNKSLLLDNKRLLLDNKRLLLDSKSLKTIVGQQKTIVGKQKPEDYCWTTKAYRWTIKHYCWTTKGYLRRGDIPSLYNRRLQDITALMYKVKHGLVSDCVSQLFVRKGSTHSLRSSDFVLPRFETTRYGEHSVRYLGRFLWSKLTDNQRDSPSLPVLINKIRTLLAF